MKDPKSKNGKSCTAYPSGLHFLCDAYTMHFSLQLLSEHFMYWKKPKEQKAIIVIILMAPLYALDSYVGLLDFQGSSIFFTFLDSIKECYEALSWVSWKFTVILNISVSLALYSLVVFYHVFSKELAHTNLLISSYASKGLSSSAFGRELFLRYSQH